MKDAELLEQVRETQERSRILQDELAETNRGLIALELEYDAQLRVLYDELAKTNSELMQLNLELEDRVAQRVAELRKAEERYRNIFENAVEGIFQYTPGGRISTANPALAQMLGYPHAEEMMDAITNIDHQLFADSDHALEFRRLLELNGIVRGFETKFFRRDQYAIWVSLNVRVMPGEDGDGYCFEGTAEDITARKRAEEDLHKLNAELEKRVAERTAQLEIINHEMEAFSYSVSHDLRAPLRIIDGFSRAIQEDYEDKIDEVGQHYLQRIRGATQRMGQLIDDLLLLSRVSRSDLLREEVDLSEIARGVAEELQERQPLRQVKFDLQGRIIVEGDTRLLRVVFENLLGNAWKFTSKTADARIEFGRIQRDDRRVHYVRDNGAGFDPEFADRLFAPFQRLHSADEFEGTGVGLATVQRIIHRHGGEVWAEAAVGQGATFYFTLWEDRQKGL